MGIRIALCRIVVMVKSPIRARPHERHCFLHGCVIPLNREVLQARSNPQGAARVLVETECKKKKAKTEISNIMSDGIECNKEKLNEANTIK